MIRINEDILVSLSPEAECQIGFQCEEWKKERDLLNRKIQAAELLLQDQQRRRDLLGDTRLVHVHATDGTSIKAEGR